jgi:Peptidase M15
MPRVTAIHIAACLLALSHIPAASAQEVSAPSTAPGQDRADHVSAVRRHGGPSTSRACLPYELKNALATIESRFGPVKVVSTHRPGARIAGTHYASYHATCRAVDFHPAPGKYREVLAYLRSSWNGGLGTYSGQMHHLHIDVGPKIVWHTNVGWPRTVAAGDRPAPPRRTAARRTRNTTGYQAPEFSPM